MAKAIKRGSMVDKPVLPNTLVVGVQTGTVTTGKGKDATLTDSRRNMANKSINDLRSLPDVREVLRIMARTNGDVSAAVSAMVRLANTKLSIRAYDNKHQLSPSGTALARSVLARFNQMYDYTRGYDDRQTVDGLKESLLREVIVSGAIAMELVLDEARLPERLMAVPPRKLKFKAGAAKIGKHRKIVPYQSVNGEDIPLDFPTFFYTSLDQDCEVAQPSSLLEPAITTSIFHADVVEDIRRVIRQSGHSRLLVKLITEQVMKSAPLEVQGDAAKMAEWLEAVRSKIKTQIENLNPETALVFFDNVEPDYLNSEIGQRADYGPLVEVIDGMQATALKTPPSILGKRMGGSQNVSSTESLLFIKTAEGIRPPVATVLSRAFTLATRLFGFDGYVMAEFDPINLRPESELEAFYQMRQARILEQLSTGMITDDEAGELLGTGPRAPDAPKLSGTMFYKSAGAQVPSPNGDPARRALTGDAPESSGGRDNVQR